MYLRSAIPKSHYNQKMVPAVNQRCVPFFISLVQFECKTNRNILSTVRNVILNQKIVYGLSFGYNLTGK